VNYNYGKRMPRLRNSVRSVQITISTTPQTRAYLDQLVGSGIYGKNPAEAAERLIASNLERLLREGVLLRPLTKIAGRRLGERDG
jgi:hypothetical protein